ncbi:uncharacterized protein MEPE_02734 [Melanopsichium pennsylvanicum]|uniref:Uncharacterized protein n=2 Tax=Melanopsichium pennsylvanicum TaxID=63383 RepID=A0AAJ4XLN1_9BASI|nr:hypothetical protein BN887_04859 [Melanopsichium pennsylvanicum 4]SNX84026.1 uncharacterized protein MEPE_02734 [Melanopsichium pennsylvanicum]
MVELRSSRRSNTVRGPDSKSVVSRQANKSRATRSQAASSSAKGAPLLQSDENAPQGRRALGDIKNVVATEASASRRKPFGDRNAPVLIPTKVQGKKGATKQSHPSTSAAQSTRPKREIIRLTPEPKTTAFSSAAPSRRTESAKPAPRQEFSHVELPSIPSSLEDPFSAQIEAAGKRAKDATLSHDELTRLSPAINSDDLEYFDISALQQTQAKTPTTEKEKHGQRTRLKNEEGEGAGSTASQHECSDKENVPPPAAHPRIGVGRTHRTTRSGAGVLRSIEQPTHSTPISQKRKPILDDIFLLDSETSSPVESPGAARRAEPMTASEQQLLNYQNQGVDKVKAWTAARKQLAESGVDGHSTGSWPDEVMSSGSEGFADANLKMEDLEEDEFGFLRAEAKLRDRNTQAIAARLDYDGKDLDEAGEVFVDIPTDPFNTSDDRRLAEHAFGHMSSPPPHDGDSSARPEPSAVILLGNHKLQAVPRDEVPHSEDGVGSAENTIPIKEERKTPEAADTSAQRVTRSCTKREREAAPAADDSDDSPMSTPPPPRSRRKTTRNAATERKSVSGLPLKRNEMQEQKALERLAAEMMSSPANLSHPTSPRATRTSKRAASSPTATKLAMDDILGFLPSRNKHNVKAKASASKGEKASSSTAGKSRAKAPSSTTSKVRAAKRVSGAASRVRSVVKGASKKKAVAVSDDEEDESVGEVSKKRTRPSHRKDKGKTRAESVDSDQEDWRNEVNSSEIHSDDSERTRRLKEFKAAERYRFNEELVI